MNNNKNNSLNSQNTNATLNVKQTNNHLNKNNLNHSLNGQPNFSGNRPHNNPTRSANNDLTKSTSSNSNLPSNNVSNNSSNSTNNKSVVKKAGNDLASKALSKMGTKGKLASMALNKLKGKSENDSNIVSSLFKRKRGMMGLGGGLLGGLTGGNKDGNSESNDNDSSNEVQDDGVDVAETVGKTVRIMAFLIQLAPFLIPIVLLFLILVIIIAAIKDPIGATEAALGLNTHNSSNPTYIYDSNDEPELAEAEREYYDKLYETIDAYQENYGVILDKYLLHSAIVFRYYMSSDDSIFTDDSGITEEDLEKALENISLDETDDETSNLVEVDYTDATVKIGVVAALMVEKTSNGTYITDSEIDGPIYENFVNSDFLTTYYADILYDDSQSSKEQVTKDIFNFAEMMDLASNEKTNSLVISGQISIYMQTCTQPYNYTTNERGNRVFDNPNVNEGTNYPEYLNMTDYLKGVVLAELGSHSMTDANREGIKAFVVAATTYLLGSFGVDFYPGVQSIGFPSGDCRQLTCDPNYGCSYDEKGGYSTTYSGVDRNVQTPGWKQPLTDEQQTYMDDILAEVFGEVMVKKGLTANDVTSSDDFTSASYRDNKQNSGCGDGCLGQEEALKDSQNGMTYLEILDKYYDANKYDVVNLKEGLYYTSTGNYNGTIQLNEEFHYHQGDSPWGSVNLCGSGDISANGCNITSAAIAISLLTNQRVTPLDLNNRQNNISTCRSSSRPQMIMDFARLYGLTPTAIKKSDSAAVEDMLSKLATGNYVAIARLAANGGRYKTSSGHYIAIVGVKTENGSTKLLVWDPGSRSSSRDNYWADLNYDILEYLRDSYSFILIGRGQ